jgi:hypothetical protein
MVGPTFDPTAAQAMSDELTRAEQGDAGAARAHCLEDFEAARARSAGKKSNSGLRGRLRGLLRRLFARGR